MKKNLSAVTMILCISCFFTIANARWEQTNGPLGGAVLALASWGDRVVAGSSGSVLLSTDGGANWKKINDNLPAGLLIKAAAINNKNIFIGTTSGLYLSGDNGASWTRTVSAGSYINAMFLRGDTIYTGTTNRVYFSKDNGANWTASPTGISSNIIALYADSAAIFAGTSTGVFVSRDSGTTWTAANTGLANPYVLDFMAFGSRLMIATNGGPYISSDRAATWTRIRSGLTDTVTTSLAAIGPVLIVGTRSGTFISSDTGANWTAAKVGLKNPYVFTLAGSGTRVLAGTMGGVYATSDGSAWSDANKGFLNSTVESIVTKGDTVFAGTAGGVFLSADRGDSWINVSSDLFAGSVTCLAPGVGADIWAGTDGGKVFVSSDFGKTWKEFKSGLPKGYSISCISVKNDYVFAGTSGRGVYLANTAQLSWGDVNVNIADNAYVSCLLATPSWQYCFADNAFFRLMISYQSWGAIRSGGYSVECLIRSNSGEVFAGSSGRGLLQYLDTLTQMNSGIPLNATVNALAVYNGYMLAGTDSSIYISANNGYSWAAFDSGFDRSPVRSLAIGYGGRAYAGVTAGGVWRNSVIGYVTKTRETTEPARAEGLALRARQGRSAVTIAFTLDRAGPATLTVCDLSGRETATLLSRGLAAGAHTVVWNTKPVRPGIYLVKLAAGGRNGRSKVAVLE